MIINCPYTLIFFQIASIKLALITPAVSIKPARRFFYVIGK